MARGGWVYVGGRAGNKPAAAEKAAVTLACKRFIAEVLKPRFLPEVRPTEFNYPIDIYGKWHGNKYRFITRYRSDDPQFLCAGIRSGLCPPRIHQPGSLLFASTMIASPPAPNVRLR